MLNLEEILEANIKEIEMKDQVILRFKHNLINEEEKFTNDFIQCIEEEVLKEVFSSVSFDKKLIRNTLENMAKIKKEEKLLLLLQKSLYILQKLEKNYLQIEYINSYNVLESFYEFILFDFEFSISFYEQVVAYIKATFNMKISIILMNINYQLMLKLDKYNEILINYPPTKDIKQLRLIEYVQTYLLFMSKIEQNNLLSTDVIKEYGYMLKVMKNNRKDLLEIEKLTIDMNKNMGISFIEEEIFLALKKSLNPNYHEKIEIADEEKYEKYITIAKQFLLDYNKINGIKSKKRKKGGKNV